MSVPPVRVRELGVAGRWAAAAGGVALLAAGLAVLVVAIRIERQAPHPADVAAASPFGGGRLEPVRWPGRVPSCFRLELMRPAHEVGDTDRSAGPRAAPAAERRQ